MIETDILDGIGVVTINRPQARNALTPELQFALIEKFRALSSDPAVGAIIVTGAGDAFCSGGDVKAMALPQTDRLDQQIADLRRREQIVLEIRNAPQVVIAQIRGAATGAGLAIALACDVRICDRSARFGAVYARVGLTGDFGISWLLQNEIGASHARRMLLDAEIVDCDTALAYGLVHEVVEDDALATTTMERARRYATGPRVAYAMLKQNLSDAATAPLTDALDFEARRLVLAKQTTDHKDAIAAFAEKRAPLFRGE